MTTPDRIALGHLLALPVGGCRLIWGRVVERLDARTWSIDEAPGERLLPAADHLLKRAGFVPVGGEGRA
jgi:hypothetical protein